MTEFLANHTDIQEEEEEDGAAASGQRLERRDSESYRIPDMDDESRVKLLSCMDEIRGIIGFERSDKQLVDAIMRFEFDFAKALDFLLTTTHERSPPEVPQTSHKMEIEKGE